MITIYTIINDDIVNRRFYKNNTVQTRDHYISTLKRHFAGKYKIINIINEYKNDFINRNVLPYDDEFTFVIEEQYFDGLMLSETFFSYNFDINSSINLTILFPHDDYESRKIFINEVVFYLKNYGYYDVYNKYINKINEFMQDDNEIIFVEKHKLSMRKEDD